MSEHAPALEATPDLPASPDAAAPPIASSRPHIPARRRKREDLARRARQGGPEPTTPAPLPAAAPLRPADTLADTTAHALSGSAPSPVERLAPGTEEEILADIEVLSADCAAPGGLAAGLILLAAGCELPGTPDAPVERLPETLDALDHRLRAAGPRRVAIVVAGDPLDDGPGRSLLAALGPERVLLRASTGTLQRALARIGFAPEDASTLRLARLGEAGLLARLRRGRLFAIDPSPRSPQQVGQLMERAGLHQARTWVVSPDHSEPVRALLAFELSDSAEAFGPDSWVVAYTAGADGSSRDWPGIPATELDEALPEAARLLALAWLQPGADECGWCIEGEHPALALDWSRERSEASVYCIGCDDTTLQAAACRHQAGDGLQAVPGGSFRSLEPLPEPNVVFIRAGEEFTQQIRTAWDRLRPGGRMVAVAESEHARLDLMQFAHRNRPQSWQDLSVAVGDAGAAQVSIAPASSVRMMCWAKPPRG